MGLSLEDAHDISLCKYEVLWDYIEEKFVIDSIAHSQFYTRVPISYVKINYGNLWIVGHYDGLNKMFDQT